MKIYLLIVLGIIFNINISFGNSYTWKGNVDSVFTNSSNWISTSGGYPGSNDTVIIVTGTYHPVLDQNRDVLHLTMTSGIFDLKAYVFTVQSYAILNNGTINNGTLTIRGISTKFNGTTVNSILDVESGIIEFNGGIFNNECHFKINGNSLSSGTGGCVFNDNVVIIQHGSRTELRMATVNGDEFNGDLKLYITKDSHIYLSYFDSSAYNGNIYVNNTGSRGSILFGDHGGVSNLASGKTISVGDSGYAVNNLYLSRFNQLGSASQNITLTGSANLVLKECTFNGNVALSSPGILCSYSTFNSAANISKTGSGTNYWYGSNTFYDNITISNGGSGSTTDVLRLSNVLGNKFYGNATFESNGKTLQVDNAGTSEFSGDIEINHSLITFKSHVELLGSINQSINGTVSISFMNLTINKLSNSVTVNTPIEIVKYLTLESGNLNTDSINLLIINAGGGVLDASNNSFVSGPMIKIGNTSFDFPVGKDSIMRIIGISAPASITDSFIAEYQNENQVIDSQFDSTLKGISECDYWHLESIVGNSSVYVKLSWNENECNLLNLEDARVGRIYNSQWRNLGQSNPTFNGLNYIQTSDLDSILGYFVLGYTNGGGSCLSSINVDSLQLCNDSIHQIVGDEFWFDFETDSSAVKIQTINPYYDIYHPTITKIELYNGTPNDLVLVTAVETTSITDDSLRLSVNGLELYSSNNYYLRIVSESNCDSCVTSTFSSKFCVLLAINALNPFVSFENICGLTFTTGSAQMNQRPSPINGSIPSTGQSQPVTINLNVAANSGYPEILGAYLYTVGIGIVSGAGQASFNCTFDNGIPNNIVLNRIALNTNSATCWESQGFNANTATYRADVTNLIVPGNINYIFNGLPVVLPPASPTTTVDWNGISLIVIFRDCDDITQPGNFYIYDGLDVLGGAFTQIVPFTPTTSNTYSNTWGIIGVGDVETANNTRYRIFQGPPLAVGGGNPAVQNNFWNISFRNNMITNGQTFNQVAFNLNSINGMDCISIPFVGVGYNEGSTVECSNLVDLQIDEYPGCNQTSLCAFTTPAVPFGVYNYLWSTSQTTTCIVAPTSGTYTVTVTGDNICSITESITITIPPPITISYTTFNACNSPCNGSIDITVTNGTAPFTYLWSNNATTEDISGLCAGTYSVTVTDVNGCTAQESIIIDEFPTMNLNLSFIESCRNDCNGSIDLTVSNGNSPYTYLWSNSEITEDITDLCEGNYTVTVTDVNGCIKIETVIIEEEHPEFIVVGDVVNCDFDNPVYTYSIINTFNSINAQYYSWSVTNGSIVSQNVSAGTADISFPQYQAGSITVTYTNPNNDCSYQYTLYIMSCCRDGDHVIEDGVLSDICAFDPSYCSNANGALVINTGSDVIVFNGTTLVDQKTLVINSNWGFGPGSAINTNGNTIEFNNSVLRANCDVMWKGIQVTSSSIVNLNNTTILDAQYGLDVMNGGSYNVYNGNIFDLNYIGMRVSGSNLLSSNVLVRRITGTTFDCTQNLLAPYGGQTPAPCSRTFAGMYFDKVYPILTVGDASFSTGENIFQNINMGIYAFKSQLSVANCKFIEIRSPGNNSCFNGTGYNAYRGGSIVAIGDELTKPVSLIRVRGFGNGANDPNMFDDCRYGLNALWSIIDVQKSKMFDMAFGVYSSSNLASEHNLILNNRIESTQHNIRILNLAFRATMKIYSNILTIDLPGSQNVGARSGIYVSQPTPLTHPISPFYNILYIRYNEIHVNNAHNGIRIDNVSWSDVIDNDIYLSTDGVNAKFGIRINGLNYHKTNENRIYGSYSQSIPQLYGFQAASSINTLIQCNTSDQNNQGFRFLGNNFPTDFWANGMIEGDVGLNLLNGARMGNQTNFGNFWIQPISPWGAFIDGTSLFLNSLFTVESLTSTLHPGTENTGGFWFSQGICTNCSNDCETIWDVEIPRRDYLAVAGDSLSNAWVEPLIWDARRNLYEMLLMRPNLADGDSILTQFLEDFENDGIGLLSSVAEVINNGCNDCNTLSESVNSLQFERDSLSQLLLANDSLLFTGISTQDSLDILEENENLVSNLSSVTNYLDSLHIILNEAIIANVEEAESLNNSAFSSLTETIELNEYSVNAIHFDILINGLTSLDSIQISTLEEIIWQCPAEGGKAVYRARTLYNQFVNDTVYFDDDSLCVLSSSRLAHVQPVGFENQDFALISPIPANDFVYLKYEVTGNQVPNYQIYDISGRLIMEKNLTELSGTEAIKVSELNTGIYYFSLRKVNKSIYNEKMIIIR